VPVCPGDRPPETAARDLRSASDHQLVRERFLLQVDANAFISAAEASNILK
jgi:hypothetical protein